VVAPLVAGEHILGALSVTFNYRREMDGEDREALQLFAAHAAAALERVRLETERREALQDLANREAETAALRQLDRLKSSLLLMISHELRTPLTLIHGYAELLQARAATLSAEATLAMAGRIHSGSTQLARLVDSLLDFARIQHGEALVEPDTFDVTSALDEVLTGFRSRPGGERLALEAPPTLRIYADRLRLAQAVSNLVENALTYATAGPIVVRAVASPVGAADGQAADASAEASGPESGPESGPAGAPDAGHPGPPVAVGVRISVSDAGPGLPADEQPHVWDSFFRGAHVAGLNVAPGSGIGLAVVKALVEAHGGQVGLDSTPGEGATFWFDLPPAPSDVRSGPATQESSASAPEPAATLF
jgi:two-component system sensor histidine kinase KdpD